jgi:hypothetical protein
MGGLNLDDADFHASVTLEQAYRILVEFVRQYHQRGPSQTVDLLGDVEPLPDGRPLDQAQLHDFLACARRVLQSTHDKAPAGEGGGGPGTEGDA